MAKAIMSKYGITFDGQQWDAMVYPECPYGRDLGVKSLEVECSHPETLDDYCSECNRNNACPFDLHNLLVSSIEENIDIDKFNDVKAQEQEDINELKEFSKLQRDES